MVIPKFQNISASIQLYSISMRCVTEYRKEPPTSLLMRSYLLFRKVFSEIANEFIRLLHLIIFTLSFFSLVFGTEYRNPRGLKSYCQREKEFQFYSPFPFAPHAKLFGKRVHVYQSIINRILVRTLLFACINILQLPLGIYCLTYELKNLMEKCTQYELKSHVFALERLFNDLYRIISNLYSREIYVIVDGDTSMYQLHIC